MVLHHVAQRTGLVVITGAAFKTDRFGNRDLHVVDMGGIPQRLVKRVGETQRHQVLHRLLAEIVVDAEDLLFLEDVTDGVVQLLRGSEIPADRLFDNDAGRAGNQLVFADLVGDIAENTRRHGQIKGAHALFTLVEQLLQHIPAIAALGVNGHVK